MQNDLCLIWDPWVCLPTELLLTALGLMSITSQQYELPPESSSFLDLASKGKMRGGWGKEGYGTLEQAIEGKQLHLDFGTHTV